MACASFSLCSLVGVAEMLNAVTKTAAAYGVNACLLATRRRWHTMARPSDKAGERVSKESQEGRCRINEADGTQTGPFPGGHFIP